MWQECVKPEFRADSKVVMIGVCVLQAVILIPEGRVET